MIVFVKWLVSSLVGINCDSCSLRAASHKNFNSVSVRAICAARFVWTDHAYKLDLPGMPGYFGGLGRRW